MNEPSRNRPESATPPTPAPAQKPRRIWRWLRRLSRMLLLASVLASCGAFWLVATESGLKTVAALAERLADGRLELTAPQGRLIGPLTLARLEWNDAAGQHVRLEGLALDWSPKALWSRKLFVQRLQLNRLSLDLAPSSSQKTPPVEISLPGAVEIAALELNSLVVHDRPVLESLTAAAVSDGNTHRLERLNFAAYGFLFDVRGLVHGKEQSGPVLAAKVDVRGRLAEHETRLDIEVKGKIDRLALAGSVGGNGGEGNFTAILTPFSRQPVERLEATLRRIDPSLWQENAPHAELDLELVAEPELTETLASSGALKLTNAKPARLDRQGLPLTQLTTKFFVRFSDSNMQFSLSDLHARFLEAGGLSAATVRFEQDAEAQRLQLAQLKLAGLSPAALHPAWPPGQIHGEFAAELSRSLALSPRLAAKTQFRLAPSRLAGRKVEGKGRLEWQQEGHSESLFSDLVATVGDNRLALRGRLGSRRDTLSVTVNAPRLATLLLPELSGDLVADLRLSGPLRTPSVAGTLASRRLSLPGAMELTGLSLAADLSGLAPDAALRADTKIARLQHPRLTLTDAEFSLTGTRTRHAASLVARLALPDSPALGQARLTLSGDGRMDAARAWKGVVKTLTLTPEAKQTPPLLALASPLALQIDADRFELAAAHFYGTVQGAPWRAELARVRHQNRQWRGEMNARLTDLAGLSPLLGPEYRLGGELDLKLELAPTDFGKDKMPALSGRLAGENLSFRMPENGFRLESGKIRLAIDPLGIDVNALSFATPLSSPPRAMPDDGRAKLKVLIATPGSLAAHGRLDFRDGGGELRFTLDRLGVLQTPEHWLAVSGTGTLRHDGLNANLDARLKLDGGFWQLTDASVPKLSDDVVIRSAAHGNAAHAGSASSQNLEARIAIDLGPNFYFAGAGVSSRLRGSLALARAPSADLRAVGDIHTVAGVFDAYGQKLAIERGILSFNGLVQNPALNILALRKQQAVEAGVAVTGTAQKPMVKLVSNPEVPDAEKLSWLVLGAAPDQTTGADDAALMAAANALLAGQERGPGSVLAQLQRRFGMQISLARGQVGGANGPSRSSRVADSGGFGAEANDSAPHQIVRVGMRLAGGLMLSYEQSMNGIDSIIKLSYALTRRLSLTAQTGSDTALDLSWNYRFGRSEGKASSGSK